METNDKDKLIEQILNSAAKASSEIPDNSSSESLEETANTNEEHENADGEDVEKEEIENLKSSKKSAKKKKKKKKGPIIVWAVIILTIAVSISVVLIGIGKDYLGVRGDTVDTSSDITDSLIEIEIPQGVTGPGLVEILSSHGIIKYPTVFRLYVKFQNPENLTAGTHLLSDKMSYEMILDELQKPPVNKQVEVKVTFPEGYTLVECAEILESNGVCDADEFIEAFNNYSYGYNFEEEIEDSTMKLYKMEGYCFPDTYIFYENSDLDAVCHKIFQNFAEKVNRNDLARMKELGLTLDETITLASIVQAEAGMEREMKNVASVFHNRLKNPEEYPKLQSDPTKKYVRTVVEPNLGDKSKELLTAYNTYESEGLPPGAICNPGYTAIKAVLYSADTDYYYFCSNLETREFYYAKTNREHERNLKAAGLK